MKCRVLAPDGSLERSSSLKEMLTQLNYALPCYSAERQAGCRGGRSGKLGTVQTLDGE